MPAQALRETVRVQHRGIPLLEWHLSRLGAGGCDASTVHAARVEAMRAAAEWSESYGRMTLLVDTDGSVHAEVTDRPSTIEVPGGPVAVIVETDIPRLPLGAAKPADRSFWDRALHQAQRCGAHVAVLVDRAGRLIDGSQATVWLVFDGTLVTPPSPPALAGVSRAVVFDLAEQTGIPTTERQVLAEELDRADEVFLTTAVAGAVAVRDRGGPTTSTIADAFARIFALE